MKILLLANQKRENYLKAVLSLGVDATIKYLSEVQHTDYDGLVLCGGNDIHPQLYGEEIAGGYGFDRERDKAEMAVLKAYLDTGKPVLGICRGFQLLNVALGGTLVQDISSDISHRGENGADAYHLVRASDGSAFYKMYKKAFSVNSNHHQAIKALGEGLVATLCSDDGIIEGFEHKSLPYLGVQFHPERMCLEYKNDFSVDGIKIFEHFIELCKKAQG
ncbi:MAG: gamma-glutamyl-gamma-aminobutyrate hydrolase family protein [Clostridia bacterium]|nr:gamma-glutamyl-gamma-aminobutyrate hydrolase family protein [Clostridia bacterium]